jgi:hypothetical protein
LQDKLKQQHQMQSTEKAAPSTVVIGCSWCWRCLMLLALRAASHVCCSQGSISCLCTRGHWLYLSLCEVAAVAAAVNTTATLLLLLLLMQCGAHSS